MFWNKTCVYKQDIHLGKLESTTKTKSHYGLRLYNDAIINVEDLKSYSLNSANKKTAEEQYGHNIGTKGQLLFYFIRVMSHL